MATENPGGTLGQRIRDARLAKGWIQRDLAARLRVQPQTVSNWEGGRSVPRLDTFDLLSRELGVSLHVLRGVSPPLLAGEELLEEIRRTLREGLVAMEDRLLGLLERQSALLEKIEERLLEEPPIARKQPRRGA